MEGVGWQVMKSRIINCMYIFSRHGRLIVRRLSVVVVTALLLSVGLSSPLSAIGGVRAKAVSETPIAYATQQAMKDACSQLLDDQPTLNQRELYKPRAHSIKRQYSKPVALSYLVGVRYFVGPKEVAPSDIQTMDTKQRHTFAIAAYRTCKKQSLLKRKK